MWPAIDLSLTGQQQGANLSLKLAPEQPGLHTKGPNTSEPISLVSGLDLAKLAAAAELSRHNNSNKSHQTGPEAAVVVAMAEARPKAKAEPKAKTKAMETAVLTPMVVASTSSTKSPTVIINVYAAGSSNNEQQSKGGPTSSSTTTTRSPNKQIMVMLAAGPTEPLAGAIKVAQSAETGARPIESPTGTRTRMMTTTSRPANWTSQQAGPTAKRLNSNDSNNNNNNSNNNDNNKPNITLRIELSNGARASPTNAHMPGHLAGASDADKRLAAQDNGSAGMLHKSNAQTVGSTGPSTFGLGLAQSPPLAVVSPPAPVAVSPAAGRSSAAIGGQQGGSFVGQAQPGPRGDNGQKNNNNNNSPLVAQTSSGQPGLGVGEIIVQNGSQLLMDSASSSSGSLVSVNVAPSLGLQSASVANSPHEPLTTNDGLATPNLLNNGSAAHLGPLNLAKSIANSLPANHSAYKKGPLDEPANNLVWRPASPEPKQPPAATDQAAPNERRPPKEAASIVISLGPAAPSALAASGPEAGRVQPQSQPQSLAQLQLQSQPRVAPAGSSQSQTAAGPEHAPSTRNSSATAATQGPTTGLQQGNSGTWPALPPGPQAAGGRQVLVEPLASLAQDWRKAGQNGLVSNEQWAQGTSGGRSSAALALGQPAITPTTTATTAAGESETHARAPPSAPSETPAQFQTDAQAQAQVQAQAHTPTTLGSPHFLTGQQNEQAELAKLIVRLTGDEHQKVANKMRPLAAGDAQIELGPHPDDPAPL